MARVHTAIVAFVIFFCLAAAPALAAQRFAVPAGTVVSGEGHVFFGEYQLIPAHYKGQGVLRLDGAGVLGPNITVEAFVKITPAAFGDAGIVYRTSNWDGAAGTFGWYAGISRAGVLLGYGTNSALPFWRQLTVFPLPIYNDVWYKLKVVAYGDSHKVYLNDREVITVYHPRFSDTAGYAGLRTNALTASFKDVRIE